MARETLKQHHETANIENNPIKSYFFIHMNFYPKAIFLLS